MSRSGWLHCHPIRHFWLQLELHLKPGASTRIFTALVAILQVTPATQPASHILPIASHCICRSTLTQFLTLSVAGAQYLAISAPRSNRGAALGADRATAATRCDWSWLPSSMASLQAMGGPCEAVSCFPGLLHCLLFSRHLHGKD